MARSGRGRLVYALVLAIGVAVLVWASNRPDWAPTHVTAVVGDGTSRELSVTVGHSRCQRGPRVRVLSENATAVRIRAEQDVGGDCEDIGLTSELTVRLEAELGTRRIEIEAPRGERPDLACTVDGRRSDRCSRVVP